jgi:hypothetical protein
MGSIGHQVAGYPCISFPIGYKLKNIFILFHLANEEPVYNSTFRFLIDLSAFYFFITANHFYFLLNCNFAYSTSY